jgi:hypothetical protein
MERKVAAWCDGLQEYMWLRMLTIPVLELELIGQRILSLLLSAQKGDHM